MGVLSKGVDDDWDKVCSAMLVEPGVAQPHR
jgi:hypothetical protein